MLEGHYKIDLQAGNLLRLKLCLYCLLLLIIEILIVVSQCLEPGLALTRLSKILVE